RRRGVDWDVSNQGVDRTDHGHRKTDEIGPTSDIGRHRPPSQRLAGCTVVPIPLTIGCQFDILQSDLARKATIRPGSQGNNPTWLARQIEHEAARVHHPSLWGRDSMAAHGALGANRQWADRHTLAVVLF